MNKKINVGIVGMGIMGRKRYQYLRDDSRVDIVGLCDVSRKVVEQIAMPHLFFEDFRQLLKLGLDAVFIATPNHLSATITTLALQNGIHVFCEKPPARNISELNFVLEEEKKHPHLKLKYGFNHRYHGSIREAKAIIDSERLGKILSIKGIYGKSGDIKFKNTWRSDRELAGGGILLDQGIHMIDLFRYFCGEFNEFKSFVQNHYFDLNVEDNVFAMMRNANNQVAVLHSSLTLWKHTFYLMISLAEGYLELKGILSSTMSYGKESLIIGKRKLDEESHALGCPQEEIIYFDRDHSWQEEIDDFFNHIIQNTPVTSGNSYDALKAMEMVSEIYHSDISWKAK